MYKLPYSYEIIREVYDKENRKGKIDVSILPIDYQSLIGKIHEKRKNLSLLRTTSTKMMSDDAKAAHYAAISTIKDEIKYLTDVKENRLVEILMNVENKILDNSYSYRIVRDEKYFAKTKSECFHTKEDDLESLIMSKLLCRDLATAFKVRTANRHHIMSCIKSLLVSSKVFYVVRTDITEFFESIPHDKLLDFIKCNQFVSAKTLGCIKSVLNQYDSIKYNGNRGIGIPRGIAISSYLAEIVMRDFDLWLKGLPNVVFYARYVDDIFIILSHLRPGSTSESFFKEIESKINELGLSLHPLNTNKSSVFKYSPTLDESHSLEYLGYAIKFNVGEITLSLSKKRFNRIKTRIDNAFRYFECSYRRNPRKARADLIDCLNLLSGNTNLHKSKNGVKTGLYYSHDLISSNKPFQKIQEYYIKVRVDQLTVDLKPFGKEVLKEQYLQRLKKRLNMINFSSRWEERTMFSFSVKRMRELSYILGE